MAQAVRKCGMIVLALFAKVLPPDRRVGWVRSNRICDLRGK
jgi:hypothetical protein